MTKDRFLKAFANLPSDEKDQVIVVIDDISYNWKRAYDEVKSDTEIGKKILKKMHELGLL